MIKECDNTEYFNWIKMSEPIFENMNIDISKIHFYMDKESNRYLPDSSGRTSRFMNFGSFPNCFLIQIRNDLQFDEFIQAYSHEVGHATQKWAYSGNSGIIAESIALKFEMKFLTKFNKKYDTNISVNPVFRKSENKIANHLKHLLILITKSQYKLKKVINHS